MPGRSKATRGSRGARGSARTHKLKAADYERAVAERFRTLWPPPRYVVKHNTRMLGAKSGAKRQIDVRISEAGSDKPFLIAEAKMHGRPLDLPHAGIVIALVKDVEAAAAVAVSASGFSVSASRYLAAQGIECMVLSVADASALRWLPHIERHFPLDRAFREPSASLFESLRNADAEPFFDCDVPYEEWLAVFACGRRVFPEASCTVLLELARAHHDDTVRFNAIRLLDEAGGLTCDAAQGLLTAERDPEVRELLCSLLGAKAP